MFGQLMHYFVCLSKYFGLGQAMHFPEASINGELLGQTHASVF